MAQSPLAAIVSRLVRGLPQTDGTSDDALLTRFVGWRDEAAFELLVYRHGPMVRALCRRVLRHEQDAEDAFQATFLALAKKATAIRGKSLAGWLYRVAFHASLKTRSKRVPCPRLGVGMGCSKDMPTQSRGNGTPEDVVHHGELAAVIDEEIARLPERYRLPVLLCYLQGRSNREAAAALGIPKGTVDSRLATARQRLRVRLIRRGLAPAVAAAVVEGTLEAAEVSGSVARAMAKVAVAFLSKQAGVPAAAAVLAEGVLHTMTMTRLTWTMAAAVALTVLGSGAGMATYGALAGEQPRSQAVARPNPGEPTARQEERRGGEPAKGQVAHPKGYAALCDSLQQNNRIDKAVEGSPLKDVLDFLTEAYGITFVVDTQAFEQAGVGGGRNVQETAVNLPRMPGVSLATVLRHLLAQVNGAYLIRKDHIEITPRDQQLMEAFAPASTDQEPPSLLAPALPPTVNVVFEARSLDQALADLAGQTGKNIVLDPRVQEKEKLTVSARLLNTGIDAAVLVLSDTVGLRSVAVGNVYYVTTRDNAERLLREGSVKEVSVAKPMAPARSVAPTKPEGK
jgi:RNA polymerase sigma factor (sigma-70 family)